MVAATALALAISASPQETPKPGVPNYDVPFHGKGRHLDSKHGRIYYETEGSGPVVILVAGGPGGSHASFHPFFSRLAKNHTVVYFDNIGRGRSDRLKDPNGYTVERDAEDIEALRVKLGQERVAVIGHSYGGMPALAYALKHPKRLSHLVLSDTLHSRDGFQQNIDSVNDHVKRQYPEVWDRLIAMRARGLLSADEKYQDLYGTAFADIYYFNPEDRTRMFRSGDPADRFNQQIYFAMIGLDPEWKVGGTMRRFDPRKRLASLRVPTLICVGRYDRVATPKVAYEMKRMLPEATSRLVIFEKSGHRPWLEETDAYFQTLGDFLESP